MTERLSAHRQETAAITKYIRKRPIQYLYTAGPWYTVLNLVKLNLVLSIGHYTF